MEEAAIRQLLERVRDGECEVAEALAHLKHLPAEMLGFAQLDHHRRLRTGLPEVVYGENKTATQIADIMRRFLQFSETALATRVAADKAATVLEDTPGLIYHEAARMLTTPLSDGQRVGGATGLAVVLAAGTSDIPVAEEATVTLRCLGATVESVYDVGVAGIHRLLARRDLLEAARVLVVVAGMEGALPSVVGGLVDRPVIAVPTSVGYGTGMGGVAALLGMLNSCVPGVVVVNIDNGFGAACAASAILRQVAISG